MAILFGPYCSCDENVKKAVHSLVQVVFDMYSVDGNLK